MKTDINPCPKRIKSRQKQAVPPKLCGANGIKDLFEVSLSTIYRWAENGTIPSVRVGGRVLFNREFLIQWIRKREKMSVRNASS